MGSTTPNPGRGGKRPGAGRPRTMDDAVRKTITITAAQAAHLERIGGNVGAGVRELVERDMAQAASADSSMENRSGAAASDSAARQ